MADEIYTTPLIEAARRGKLKYVKIFIEEEEEKVDTVESKISPLKTDSYYEDQTTALHEACSNGHLEVVEYLVEKGADVGGYWRKCKRDQKQPLKPITLAAQNGHANVVRYLLSKGANVNETDNDHRYPPIDYAITEFQIDAVKVLLNAKANLVYQDQNALCRAVGIGGLLLVKCLLEHGANIDERCKKSGLSPLSHAISANDTKIVAYLLRMGANYRQQDFKTRYLPLQSGIKLSDAKCKESVDILLNFILERQSYNALVEYLNNNDSLTGKTALHLVFQAYAKDPTPQTVAFMESLLAYGSDPKAKDDFGREPCHWQYIRNAEIREKLVDLIRTTGHRQYLAISL